MAHTGLKNHLMSQSDLRSRFTKVKKIGFMTDLDSFNTSNDNDSNKDGNGNNVDNDILSPTTTTTMFAVGIIVEIGE